VPEGLALNCKSIYLRSRSLAFFPEGSLTRSEAYEIGGQSIPTLAGKMVGLAGNAILEIAW
jgi:hypothetical protein